MAKLTRRRHQSCDATEYNDLEREIAELEGKKARGLQSSARARSISE
jgi:hypothetical protein